MCKPTVVANQQLNATGVAVDENWLYWGTAEGLVRAPKRGGKVSQLDALKRTSFVVRDGQTLYYGGLFGKLRRLSTADPTVVDRLWDPPRRSQMEGLVVGTDSIYWLFDGHLYKLSRAGGEAEDLGYFSGPWVALAVTPEGTPLVAFEDGIVSVSPLGARTTLYSEKPPNTPNWLMSDSATLFWSRGDRKPSTISAGPRNGGGVRVLDTLGEHGLSWRGTLDERNVYWSTSDPAGSGIYGTSKLGGPRRTYHDHAGELGDLVVDDTHLYWVDPYGRRVMSVAK